MPRVFVKMRVKTKITGTIWQVIRYIDTNMSDKLEMVSFL